MPGQGDKDWGLGRLSSFINITRSKQRMIFFFVSYGCLFSRHAVGWNLGDQVAVGEQDRAGLPVRLDPHPQVAARRMESAGRIAGVGRREGG